MEYTNTYKRTSKKMYQQHHLQWPCVTKMNNLQVSSIHDQNEQQQQQQPKSVAIIIELKKQQQLK